MRDRILIACASPVNEPQEGRSSCAGLRRAPAMENPAHCG